MFKKLLCAIAALTILSTNFFTAAPARAASVYGRAITENVGFYQKKDAPVLFYLPYTYYVKISEHGAAVSRAEIFSDGSLTPAIDGYVYTDELYYDDTVPATPFYEQTLTTAKTASFYANAAGTEMLRYIFENRSLRYYGYVTDAAGHYMYFAEYNGQLGYVAEDSVMPFTFVKHPNPLPSPVTPEKPGDTELPKKNGGLPYGIKIAIIVSLCLAGVTVFIFALKPEKKHKEVAFYDDNDYE